MLRKETDTKIIYKIIDRFCTKEKILHIRLVNKKVSLKSFIFFSKQFLSEKRFSDSICFYDRNDMPKIKSFHDLLVELNISLYMSVNILIER